MILNIITLKCPHCGKARISAGLFKTAKVCPACHQVLEKESGFFAGAIYPLYGMAAFLGGLVALVCLFAFDWAPFASAASGATAALLASPYLFWLSRSAFLHAEQRFFRRLGN